jgi:hypothetical protein
VTPSHARESSRAAAKPAAPPPITITSSCLPGISD